MRVQRNQDDQRWKYRTYHLRRLCRHHLKNVSFSSNQMFREIVIFEISINPSKNHDFEESRFLSNRGIRAFEFSSYRLDGSRFSETYRFLSFGVWVCRGDCRILGGRKVFRVSCGHQRGHQFLNFRLFIKFWRFPILDYFSKFGFLSHDSVPSFPVWITELKIMKIIFPSKLILQKRNLWNI